MWIKVLKDGLSSDYESKSKWVGSSFLIVGFITAFYALFSVLALHSVIGIALLISGSIVTYGTVKLNPTTVISWLKSLHLIFFGLFFLLYPSTDVETHMSCIGSFFLLEAILTLILAYAVHEKSVTSIWVINALLYAIFAYLFLLSPQNVSEVLIGVFVAVVLIIDGSAILYSGRKVYIRP